VKISKPSVPVSALTFLTAWDITQKQKNGAPPAVTVADAIPSLGSLLVDMATPNNQKASSSVSASRRFRVGPGSEMVSIGHAFATLLEDAMLKVTIKISPAHGFKIPTTSFNMGSGMSNLFNFSDQFNGTLPEGDYNVKIKIAYKNRNGSWDNNPPGSSSPHTFTIQSI
jgi:hypothetical protein